MFGDINKDTCCLTGSTWQLLPCGVLTSNCAKDTNTVSSIAIRSTKTTLTRLEQNRLYDSEIRTSNERVAVDAAGFVWLRGCFDGFSAVMLLHRYVILWELTHCSSSYTLPKETRQVSVPGGKKVATVAFIQIKREYFPTVNILDQERIKTSN